MPPHSCKYLSEAGHALIWRTHQEHVNVRVRDVSQRRQDTSTSDHDLRYVAQLLDQTPAQSVKPLVERRIIASQDRPRSPRQKQWLL